MELIPSHTISRAPFIDEQEMLNLRQCPKCGKDAEFRGPYYFAWVEESKTEAEMRNALIYSCAICRYPLKVRCKDDQ